MHDHRVALLDHPFEQLPHPSVAHSHLLGGLPLADASLLGSSQPVQLIPFLLAHRDSFHPLALRLSRGTFYFGQLGTSHFGATLWGEHGMSKNILHMVLARLPEAPDGSAGISLFAVPKFLPDGGRNAVRCLSLEEKLGGGS